MGLLKLEIKLQTNGKYPKLNHNKVLAKENEVQEGSDRSKRDDRRKERRLTALFHPYQQHRSTRPEDRQEHTIFLFLFHSSLSPLLHRFILHLLLRLTKFQFLCTPNEFNMTSSHQNSNIFCCSVHFSQE